MLYTLTITKPNTDEQIVLSDIHTIQKVAETINDILFTGIRIVSKQALYNLMTRPDTISNCRYKNYIDVVKVKSVA
jgi:hypothetical protein